MVQLTNVQCLTECKRDEDGYYWIVGRVDDCMNVSGHLLSTAEIESALVEHGAVCEAAVVNITSMYLRIRSREKILFQPIFSKRCAR